MRRRLNALSFLPVCLGSAWLPAWAQNTLTVPMDVVRISNPNMVPDRPIGDEAHEGGDARRGDVTLLRLHPQYTLRMASGASRTELALGGMIERSSDTALSANRSLPSVGVLWERDSPTGVFGLRASLLEESTREAEFADFGRVVVDSTQRTGSIGASWARELTSRTDLELAVFHARVRYDTPLLRGYDDTGASARYRWQSGANHRYTLTAHAARQQRDGESTSGDVDERNRISRLGGVLGYERDLREGVSVAASAGAMRTGSPDNQATHAVGSLRLALEGERLGYAVEWRREASADGSALGYTRADTFGASFSYPLTVYTALSVGVSHARTLDAGRDEGTLVYARIRSELTPLWVVSAGLEHRRARSVGMPLASGQTVTMGLVYTHPDF